jgi:hypothetical protein
MKPRIIHVPSGVQLAGISDAIEVVTFAIDDTGALTETITTPNGPCCYKVAMIGPAGQFEAGAFITSCRHFGLAQTDVFGVDKAGALTVAWQPDNGSWTAPVAISPGGRFTSGAPLAACQQFGLVQTDVFGVDEAGALNVSWAGGGSGHWQGPSRISPQGMFPSAAYVSACQQANLNQTDVFAVDLTGALTVSWVDDAGSWQGLARIGPAGLSRPGERVCANCQPAMNRTNVCVFGLDRMLNLFWVVGAGAWNGPSQQF